MNEQAWQVEQFERHRPHLRAVAYRMLGSLSEADDAVQEAWLRLSRSDTEAVENLGGWLTTVVGRVCLDMLRVAPLAPGGVRRQLAARADRQPRRRGRPRAGGDARRLGRARAARRARDADARRAAGVRAARHVRRAVRRDRADRRPHAGRGPPAGEPRPAPRARRRAEPDADLSQQREVVDAFLAASRAGDFDALLAVLDPDVVFRVDSRRGQRARPAADQRGRGRRDGRSSRAARGSRPTRGRRSSTARPASSSGPQSRPIAVVGFTVARGRIVEIDLIADPDKLRGVTS